jgi:hypothetical protein
MLFGAALGHPAALNDSLRLPAVCSLSTPFSPSPHSLAAAAARPQVRKAWMKANLLVHPDKVRQRSGSDEQVAIADMIFDALKEAWGQFKG